MKLLSLYNACLRPRRRLWTRVMLLAITGLLSSCLDFEEQTVSYHFEERSDTLRIYQNYRGIFGSEAQEADGDALGLSSEEETQLESVLQGQRTFFFSNWILEYDRGGLEELREQLQNEEALEEAKLSEAEANQLDRVLALLIDHVQVGNGPFYFDETERLCGVQTVTVEHVSRIVNAVNQAAPVIIRSLLGPDDYERLDAALLARFRAKGDLSLIEWGGGVLTVRFPMEQAHYDEGWGSEASDPQALKKIREAGVQDSFEAGVFSLVLGKRESRPVSISIEINKGKYRPNAVAAAKKALGIERDFDPVRSAKAFLFGTAPPAVTE